MYSEEEIKKRELEDVEYKLNSEAFEDSREIMRKRIITHLLKLGYEFRTAKGNVSPNPSAGGKGVKSYTSQGRMEPYDLRHVKYVETHKGDITVFISMQPLEKDSKTHNTHNLQHHIGVRVFKGTEEPEDEAYNNYFNMKLTGVNSPLTLRGLDDLADFIEKEIELIK